MSYSIRKLQPGEFALLIPLMKNCFGMDVDIAYFEWKFLKNPAGTFEGFVAQAPDGAIAAYYGVIPEVYIVDGKQTTLYQSCDTMTHSDHRRKGLFEKLARHCYTTLESENKLFVIGFGGGQSTPGFIKFGWRHIFNIRHYFYPLIFCYWPSFHKTDDIREVSDLSSLKNLSLKSNSNSKVRSQKDATTFSWRLSNPLHKYRTVAVETNGEYSSYLCYYRFENKIVLFDFYFGEKKDKGKLMSMLKSEVRKNKFKGIVAFCQENRHHASVLRDLGFITNPFQRGPLSEKTPFIVYSTPATLHQVADPLKWDINSFDHDSL